MVSGDRRGERRHSAGRYRRSATTELPRGSRRPPRPRPLVRSAGRSQPLASPHGRPPTAVPPTAVPPTAVPPQPYPHSHPPTPTPGCGCGGSAASEPKINYVTARDPGRRPPQEGALGGSCPAPPGALGLAQGPSIWEAGNLLSEFLDRCSLSCTVIVILELQSSFLDVTLWVPEMEPCAKTLRKAIGTSAAAIVPSGGSEIFYNQMSKTPLTGHPPGSPAPLPCPLLAFSPFLCLWETLDKPVPSGSEVLQGASSQVVWGALPGLSSLVCSFVTRRC